MRWGPVPSRPPSSHPYPRTHAVPPRYPPPLPDPFPSLPFPLNDVSEDTTVSLKVFDRDIGHFNSFVGMVGLGQETAEALVIFPGSRQSAGSGAVLVQ